MFICYANYKYRGQVYLLIYLFWLDLAHPVISDIPQITHKRRYILESGEEAPRFMHYDSVSGLPRKLYSVHSSPLYWTRLPISLRISYGQKPIE